MMNDIKLYNRKAPLHHSFKKSDNFPIIIFLTVCCKGKNKILANDYAHMLLLDAWQKSGHWIIGQYLIMPDHIHLICRRNNDDCSNLGQWVKYWKGLVTKQWKNESGLPLWQLNYWDRQIRNEEHLNRKWEYVRNNPVYDKLVDSPDDWKYQGHLNTLI